MSKAIIKNSMELARIMTIVEAGKSQIKHGDAKELFAKLEKFDLLVQEAGYESPLVTIANKNATKIHNQGIRKNAENKLAGFLIAAKIKK